MLDVSGDRSRWRPGPRDKGEGTRNFLLGLGLVQGFGSRAVVRTSIRNCVGTDPATPGLINQRLCGLGRIRVGVILRKPDGG